jgi:predicted transcriptional regulator
MKTASLPSLRVDPELRRAVESVLEDGESLSSFVEDSVREGIERRRLRSEFVARGLASRDEAKRSGEYFSADQVQSELDGMLKEAEARSKTTGR